MAKKGSKREVRMHHDDPVQAVANWFTAVPLTQVIDVGIDPGLSGALGYLAEGQPPLVVDLPTYSVKTGTKTAKGNTKVKHLFDFGTIHQLMSPVICNPHRFRVHLERVHPMPRDRGVVGFGMGLGWGMWPLYFTAFGIPFYDAWPHVWKKEMKLTKDKDKSRALAMKMFPSLATWFRCVSDDGRAEALILARYGQRKNQPA